MKILGYLILFGGAIYLLSVLISLLFLIACFLLGISK